MTADRHIRIEKPDLFTPEVDQAVEVLHKLGEREPPPEPTDSPLRRLLNSSLFYLPLAGFLGALLTWMVLEPNIQDFPRVGGQVSLVDANPTECAEPGCVAITVGKHQMFALPKATKLEPGENGQQAIQKLEAIQPGAWIEVVVLKEKNALIAMAVRPSTKAQAKEVGQKLPPEFSLALIALFPLTALIIATFLFVAEGISHRNWSRMVTRTFAGAGLVLLFSVLAFIPAGLFMLIVEKVLDSAVKDNGVITVVNLKPVAFLGVAACRSAAWTCIGLAMGLGMNVVRATRLELRNSALGGALGGAFGGFFFDPVHRLFLSDSLFQDADVSRAVGMIMVGLAVGFFMALAESLGRQAWVRVRTGPLAGKSFILYRSPTLIGGAPQADIYLFKDAQIEPEHAAIHRVGDRYEIEDRSQRTGVQVAGTAIERHRLVSGEQIVVGGTVLEFEERRLRAHGRIELTNNNHS